MEWWLIVSGAFNMGLAVVVASQYFGWKAADERADKYQDAFSKKVDDYQRAKCDIREARDMLKQYSDKVYEADEDVWLAVFKSGVESE